MCWDRLFGTFEAERADDPVRYGTRAPVRSWNPLWVNLDTPWQLLRDAWRAPRWADKLSIWLRPPGWRPAGLAAIDPKPAFDLARHAHYATDTPAALSRYALVQSALLVPPLIHLIFVAYRVPFWPELAYALYLSWASVALGMLIDGRPARRAVGLGLELARWVLTAVLALRGTWFGELALPPWAALALALAAGASTLWLALRWRMRGDVPDRLATP